MKAKTFLLLILVAIASAAATWFIVTKPTSTKAETSNGRKILYYQSAMHPWIKSDKPGKCTVCGMDLVPVYEGEHGFDSASGVVVLSSNTINVINVQTSEVKKRPLLRTLRVAGQIEADDTRRRILAAYVDGRVDKLFVNYVGAEVKEGEPLAQLFSPMLLSAEREYLSLAKQKPVSDALQVDRERMVEGAAQRLKLLGLSEKQIATLREKGETVNQTEILAPMSGTVISRDVYEGKYVTTGEKLFELGDFSTMWFKFEAYERDLPWIAVGQTVDVTTPSLPAKTFIAKISFIDPNVSDPTRSTRVRVEIPNPLITTNGPAHRELLHRLFAEGVVRVESPEVLTVARTAVLWPGQTAVVYVSQSGGAYEQRKVKLGRAGDAFWEVLEGLKEGEAVVTTGNLLIDAQAQLAESAKGSEAVSAKPHNHLPALNADQKGAANEFLKVASSLSVALAADNLQDFNETATKLHTATSKLSEALGNAESWNAYAQKIEQTAHIPETSDLSTARKSFLPLSLATTELARQLRVSDTNFAALKIFKCPMVNQAVPGAAKDGFWIQENAPLRNPFFGSEMLDCGEEVK